MWLSGAAAGSTEVVTVWPNFTVTTCCPGALDASLSLQPGQPADSIEAAIGVLREILLGIGDVYIDRVPIDQLLEAAVEGIRRRLDPHTKLLSLEEFERVRSQRETAVDSVLIEEGRVGYLRIRRFGRGCAATLERILITWSQRDLDGLVIDLRGNPGGFLSEGIEAADLLLPIGKEIVRTVGRLREEAGTAVSTREPLLLGVPRALLVDSLTASSAEIFAGALKASAGAVLLGEPTCGKRTVQRLRPISTGGALKVTSAYFRTPADPDFHTGNFPVGYEPSPAPKGVEAAGSGRNSRAGAVQLQPDLLLTRIGPGGPADWEEHTRPEGAGRIAAIELDPWVRQAVRELSHPTYLSHPLSLSHPASLSGEG